MKRHFLGLCVGATLFAGFTHAEAATYDFTFSANDGFFGTATGSFQTNATGVVTSLTGTENVGAGATSYAMTLLLPGAYASNDNQFSTTSPYFDFAGISWVADSIDFNLGSGFYQDSANGLETNVSITVSQTPLPAALPMLAGGLGALGLLGWRKRRKMSAVAAG